ncbi:hypothetical protein LAUMK4_03659 [Mycobacterium persicum]|uniref:Uncharacterized protein n=1 Tax=Mycobacterium persicum TaxID=1487726 RepID=A0AB38UWJ9_9MYCO|nr:hypothetical protein LAUMK15_04059 [Mycobacterium persicum]VAZ84885.1 hypothetical protein LAUMK42_03712 [Mycobacterium persicum]VAZ96852.1 hypothetical protein LAUMK4_03659 [Mycobacterium persicum]
MAKAGLLSPSYPQFRPFPQAYLARALAGAVSRWFVGDPGLNGHQREYYLAPMGHEWERNVESHV